MSCLKKKALPLFSLAPWVFPLSLLLYGFTLLPIESIAVAFAGAFWGMLIIKAT